MPRSGRSWSTRSASPACATSRASGAAPTSGTSPRATRIRSTAFAVHGPKPANQRWNRYFRDVIAQITDDAGELLWYDEVFHSDGPPLDGPFERALFGLVIDPERSDDYEALHANAWPDLIEAIEASGFRNYTGFRRGAHVVYYGEFYPDMATVFAKMGATEVNARWGEAFEGIIIKITDDAGNLSPRTRSTTRIERPLRPVPPTVNATRRPSTRRGHRPVLDALGAHGRTDLPGRPAGAGPLRRRRSWPPMRVEPVDVLELASGRTGSLSGAASPSWGRRRPGRPDDGRPGGLDHGRARRAAGRPGRRVGPARDGARRWCLRPRLDHDPGRDRRGADAVQPAVPRRPTVRARARSPVRPGHRGPRPRGPPPGRRRARHRREPARPDRPAARGLRPRRRR